MIRGIFSKKCVGIDIGAASIKVVEVSIFAKKRKLENYAEFRLSPMPSAIRTFHGENLLLLNSDKVSGILEGLFKKAGIKEKRVTLSLPDFSTFFTTFTLPPMTESEVPRAVEFEARHHIPVPLSEVTFDWKIIEKEKVLPGVKLKVLLVAVPNRVLQSYQRAATLARLEVVGTEAEVFGLIRSSIPKDKSQIPICLIDIGWQSTTISIVEKGGLRMSYSFDISGTGLTKALSSDLNIGLEEAEQLKKRYGIEEDRKDISEVLLPKINFLIEQIEKVCRDFQESEHKTVENIILSGGTAALPGLKEYLARQTKKNLELANPFSSVSFPLILRNRLKKIGPSFAVAVGVALMGVET